ncbi:MAG: hypothetical protein HOW97_12230 [Catenulispora sp.]|nr:hypothetical protein [Catenulispora sp.]
MTSPVPPPNGQPEQWNPGPEFTGIAVPPTFQPQPPVPLPVYEQSATPQLADQGNAAPQIPEGGYAKRFVDVPLPELNLPGIECKVRMRNPGMMSQGAYEEITKALDGMKLTEDAADVADFAKQLPVMQVQMLKLIASWTVWDAESAEDVPPLLPSPPTSVDDLKRAPMGVMTAMMAAFKELSDPQ